MKSQTTIRGIAFMLMAMLIFSLQDGISKHLAAHYSTVLITMLRYWVFGLAVVFGSRAAALELPDDVESVRPRG